MLDSKRGCHLKPISLLDLGIIKIAGDRGFRLGVAGRAVQTKARNCDGMWQTAIVLYGQELERSTRKMMTEDMEGYPDFCATVRTSVDMVDEWAQKKGMWGERGKALVCSDLLTRMNVFPRQTRIPEIVLKRLWGEVDDDDVSRITDELVDLNLLSKIEDEKKGVSVGLHDLVLEYCVIQDRRYPWSFHRNFLDEYLTASEDVTASNNVMKETSRIGDWRLDEVCNTLDSREWWSLSSDGYFPENVCRHLWKGGCVGELMELLCDERWTLLRMRCGGLLEWKSDFESLESASSEVKRRNRNGDEWDKMKSGFRLVREAVNESRVYLKGNARELGMQVYSRLLDVDEEIWPVSLYLRSVRTHWEKPWLLPSDRYWARPGTSGNVELLMGEPVNCIAMSEDGSTLAMEMGKKSVCVCVMDIESRSMLWREPDTKMM